MNNTTNDHAPAHLDEDDDNNNNDVVQCINGHDAAAVDNPQIRYDALHSPLALAFLDAVASQALYDPDIADNNQLTLSFRNDVYVFDSVSLEKVEAVLGSLGGVGSSIPGWIVLKTTGYEQASCL